MNGKFLRGPVNYIYVNAREEMEANFTTTGNALLSPLLWLRKTIRGESRAEKKKRY
jgi:hypothetical protein